MERSTRWLHRGSALEIREEDFPRIFEKSGKPALVISTLEALAVLVARKVFVCKGRREHRIHVQVAPTWTDNRGNGSALKKAHDDEVSLRVRW